MGKLKLFEISFANTNAVFYAGTLMQGQVTVELTEPMKMRAILLQLEGKADVSWSETTTTTNSDNTTSTNTYTYSNSEKYFDQSVLLFGTGQGSTELTRGRHIFPFQFQIPPALPSSFEGGTGHVRYLAKCKIDKPWKFNHHTMSAFTIISILDLNQQPNCTQSLQGYKEKTLCCLCCTSGPISASFHIHRQGYVPGEAIILNAEITNGTSRRIKSYVSLNMVTTFHATTSSTSSTKVVARVTRPEIAGHREDVWNGEQLVIPPLPPSFLIGCKIIDIKYYLQLTVEPSGPAISLTIPFEIIIGTIPLASVVQHNPPSPPPNLNDFGNWNSASALPNMPYPPDMQKSFYELPPPSYNECITGRVNIRDKEDSEHTRGTLEYAPAYTYYNWGNTPSALPTGNN